MRVEGWIGHTDARAISAFKQAVINDPDGPVKDWPGVLACLQCIAEGLRLRGPNGAKDEFLLAATAQNGGQGYMDRRPSAVVMEGLRSP